MTGVASDSDSEESVLLLHAASVTHSATPTAVVFMVKSLRVVGTLAVCSVFRRLSPENRQLAAKKFRPARAVREAGLVITGPTGSIRRASTHQRQYEYP